MIDNWKHRSAQMRCNSCIWFVPKGEALGRCRRRAPTLAGYPAVFTTDFCGDHKLRDNALAPLNEEILSNDRND